MWRQFRRGGLFSRPLVKLACKRNLFASRERARLLRLRERHKPGGSQASAESVPSPRRTQQAEKGSLETLWENNWRRRNVSSQDSRRFLSVGTAPQNKPSAQNIERWWSVATQAVKRCSCSKAPHAPKQDARKTLSARAAFQDKPRPTESPVLLASAPGPTAPSRPGEELVCGQVSW